MMSKFTLVACFSDDEGSWGHYFSGESKEECIAKFRANQKKNVYYSSFHLYRGNKPDFRYATSPEKLSW